MKYLTLFSILCTSLLIISCGDDPILGCTDPAASTYNALATEDSGDCKYPGCTDADGDSYDASFNEDDGSCTYFDRFVGSYAGTFVCEGIFAGLLDEASAEITKKAGDENMNLVSVVVSNPATDITLHLEGTITKDEVVINTFIPDFEYSIDFNGIPVEGPYEVTVTGNLVRMNETTLAGPIFIGILKVGTVLGTSDTCQYTATIN